MWNKDTEVPSHPVLTTPREKPTQASIHSLIQHICNTWLLWVRWETHRLISDWGQVRKQNKSKGLTASWAENTGEPTFWGASCSGTSHSSSEAAGSCIPSNCFRSPIATASADVECRKQWELERRESREAEHRGKTGRSERSLRIPYHMQKHASWGNTHDLLNFLLIFRYTGTVKNILCLQS
jgi:hypothetical protein